MELEVFVNLVLLIIFAETKNTEKFCDPITSDISRQCFIKETIVSIPHSPNQIAVDRSNNLYFSFDSGQGDYVPAKIKLGNTVNNSIVVLKGIKDAFAMAHNPMNGEMYFGGSHGIYKYQPEEKRLKRLSVDNLDVWWLVVRNDIYFIKFPSLSAYMYTNRSVRYVPELKNHNIHQFVFDIDDNIYFINSSGLYGIKKEESNAILLSDVPRFLGMASDSKGYVYVCSEDGIFIISKVVQKVKRIINVQGVLGITFDVDNNIIYSDSQEIVRLIPSSKETYWKSLTTF